MVSIPLHSVQFYVYDYRLLIALSIIGNLNTRSKGFDVLRLYQYSPIRSVFIIFII